MPNPYNEARHTWSGTATSVGTGYTAVNLNSPATFAEYYLEDIVIQGASISGMSTFDWYLAADSSGTKMLTPVQTGCAFDTLMNSALGYATALAKGRKVDSRGNGLYLCIKGNAGTFDVEAYVEGMRL